MVEGNRLHMDDPGSVTLALGESSKKRSYPKIKTIKFALGKGNKVNGKIAVVDRNLVESEEDGRKWMHNFIDQSLCQENFLGNNPPKVLISVTGAAGPFPWDFNYAKVFYKGLVEAAESTTAWIVSGGTDVGIMHHVGEAIASAETDVPTIGFATYNKIYNRERFLDDNEDALEYNTTASIPAETDNVSLNANHSHFILVNGKDDEKPKDFKTWGQEIKARSDFEEYICSKHKLPACLIVVNGGPGTLQTVQEGLSRNFQVVVMEGTGRAADAISYEIRKARGPNANTHMSDELTKFMANFKPGTKERNWLDFIVNNENKVTLYSYPTGGKLDVVILKALLRCGLANFQRKMELAIEWDRKDLVEDLLEGPDRPIDFEEFNHDLSNSMSLVLDLQRAEIFRLLAEKGARKQDIDLAVLYSAIHPDTKAVVIDRDIARFGSRFKHKKKYDAIIEDSVGTVDAEHNTGSMTDDNSNDVNNNNGGGGGSGGSGEGSDNGGEEVNSPTMKRRLISDKSMSSTTRLTETQLSFIKGIFKNVDPIFELYAESIKSKFVTNPTPEDTTASGKKWKNPFKSAKPVDPFAAKHAAVSYTDTMLWAILMGKLDLAKVIWEVTTLPVHAALVAAGLCKAVANWLFNEQEGFLEAAAWFEEVAVKLLEELEYDSAKRLLEHKWNEFGLTALELAYKTQCKDFTARSYVQGFLDERLYSNDYGGIPPGTSSWKVVVCILLPFLMKSFKVYDNINQELKPVSDGRWYHFYFLPYVKFWTSTFCYIGYLVLLAIVLTTNQEGAIATGEVILWIWMIAYAVEEISQLAEEGKSYFSHLSNQMDIWIIVLQAVYIGLAITASITPLPTPDPTMAPTPSAEYMRRLLEDGSSSSDQPLSAEESIRWASTDILIILTIISFIRFLSVFSISKELGPLYFVLQKIVFDVLRWIFVFSLFAIGFQLAFMALTEQSGEDKWQSNINGGSFMGAFYTIIGDYDTTMQVVHRNKFAIVVVSIYALIAQIALVNLLIAMMGDTFNSVKENSDREWKFSRYEMIAEYASASFDPPPFNLITFPFIRAYRVYQYFYQITHAPVELTEEQKFEIEKQGVKFKNLMRNTKDRFLEARAEEESKTLESVANHAHRSFAKIIEDQQAMTDMFKKEMEKMRTSIAANAAAGPNPAAGSQAVATLARSDDVAIRISLQGGQVPITWEAGVSAETVRKIIDTYGPFKEWVADMNKPANSMVKVNSINIQAVDLFGNGGRIGFVKFHAKAVNPEGKLIPGIVFMRGAAVGILVIMKLNQPGDPNHGKEFTILTIQPRVPVANSNFAEIPAGMLDGGNFLGVAASELKEETGLVIKTQDLIDLTGLAYGSRHKGVYPSAGGCDEYLRLFLYRVNVNGETLRTYENKLTGLLDEGETICLKVIPVENLWLEAPDVKALSALYLYHALAARGQIVREY